VPERLTRAATRGAGAPLDGAAEDPASDDPARLGRLLHDLRGPLTSVLRYGELLADGTAGPLTEPQSALLVRVQRNAERLVALLDAWAADERPSTR
jgi:signal transduction histidine kinase